MKILTQIRFYVVVVTIAFLSLGINYLNLKDELTKCQTDKGSLSGGDIEKAELRALVDSLRDENFIKSTEIGRYEITLDWLKETNPKAHAQFEHYLYTETE